jgi:hypothetical protein
MDLFNWFLLLLFFGVIWLPFLMVRLLLATWAEYRSGRRSLATFLFVALLVAWMAVVADDLVGGGWMSKFEWNRGGEVVVGVAGLATTLLGIAGIVSDRRRRRATSD